MNWNICRSWKIFQFAKSVNFLQKFYESEYLQMGKIFRFSKKKCDKKEDFSQSENFPLFQLRKFGRIKGRGRFYPRKRHIWAFMALLGGFQGLKLDFQFLFKWCGNKLICSFSFCILKSVAIRLND